MGYYKTGDVIRLMRSSLGITQEDLSEGVCSVETLSRIENGKHAVKEKVYRELMMKMEHNPMKSYAIFDSTDMDVFETRIMLDEAIIKRDFRTAKKYLEILEHDLELTMQNQQYLRRIEAIILFKDDEIEVKEYISRLKEALQLTVKDYERYITDEEGKIAYPFLENEIMILVNLANAYMRDSNYAESLKICNTALKCTEKKYIDKQTAMEVNIILRSNRIKVFEEQKLYNKALDEINELMQKSRECGYVHVYTNLLTSMAWNTMEKSTDSTNNFFEKDVKKTLKLAYYFSAARKEYANMDMVSKYYKDCFSIEL